jgi:gas vesicle protein
MAYQYANTGIVFAKEDVSKELSPNVKGVPFFEYYFKGKKISDSVGADENEIRQNIENLKQTILQQQQHQANPNGFPKPYNPVNRNHAQVNQVNPMTQNPMMRRM